MYGADEAKGLTLKERLEHKIQQLNEENKRLRRALMILCDTQSYPPVMVSQIKERIKAKLSI